MSDQLLTLVQKLLAESFPESTIKVVDTQGNGYHLDVIVESSLFLGKTRVQQHQMVYNVLKDMIKDGTLHAVTIKPKVIE